MKLTNDQQNALELFKTGANMLLLGDPGTGKTTVISAIVKNAEERGLKVGLTASTGIAAQLIGGRTIHSFLKSYPGMNQDAADFAQKAQNLNNINVLIIDEISMLGKTFIKYLYQCLSHASHTVQLVLVGDFFQLPPVRDDFAFNSFCWDMLELVPCILTEVVRQKDADFIRSINLLKAGNKSCLSYLSSQSCQSTLSGQISICAKREEAQLINNIESEKLHCNPIVYLADYTGAVNTSDLRVEERLVLKQGMRVMSIMNGHGFSNGSIGTVLDLNSASVEVLFDNGTRAYFTKTCFEAERIDCPGEITNLWQIPLIPAYAITIHRSQGQTFQYVNINGRLCWAPGQLYVAVSRAVSIDGIHFITPIRACNIRTSPDVIRFYKNIQALPLDSSALI